MLLYKESQMFHLCSRNILRPMTIRSSNKMPLVTDVMIFKYKKK